MQHDLRVFGRYKVGERKAWVITEAERRSTCMLLPDEYFESGYTTFIWECIACVAVISGLRKNENVGIGRPAVIEN